MSVDATTPEARARHRAPQLSSFQQWKALTGRVIASQLRTHELTVALIAPAIFAIGFYLPLRFVMRVQGIDYAQFVMPIIVLQAMAFTAISAAGRGAAEELNGINPRFKTMPIGPAVPLLARIAGATFRSALSLLAALIYGYLIGFRFTGGVISALLFVGIAMLVGTAFALGGDAIGVLSRSPEATSQALTLPQLILGMLSTGFVPEEGFPEWIRPFARNQPISQFAVAMRDLAEGTVASPALVPALLWCLVFVIVFAPLSIWANVRRG
ncbi:ABC transporter permease [Rhodococcus sp. BP-349]|uniref:ABC transporter permease n=1 Tax=unclassified Rhodococcus (in: high G+C Gram-positive bacteria) TaxID=192944 RepID=UPI001C9B1D4A|nr:MULTISPECIES: ABC transporter permease [unclassified Rhodococcus (in: high G+C Gram-positive bacteria)]MBY6539830.1 ABC transporter permease [Rhodococcus sp. BP-363]MBY6543842.1 ABC transporter permease [Rhodococcus sp. BP-369]MBY6563072.1 ABC transporter permease [Rhodococcus sp. BP-370]MBY6577364.1 ABC transporter permease [Rhodococcus sp. BP-364]MBY6586665.1 ABC transporter permease [Rhodococcus sp. BP-358]